MDAREQARLVGRRWAQVVSPVNFFPVRGQGAFESIAVCLRYPKSSKDPRHGCGRASGGLASAAALRALSKRLGAHLLRPQTSRDEQHHQELMLSLAGLSVQPPPPPEQSCKSCVVSLPSSVAGVCFKELRWLTMSFGFGTGSTHVAFRCDWCVFISRLSRALAHRRGCWLVGETSSWASNVYRHTPAKLPTPSSQHRPRPLWSGLCERNMQ